MGPPVPEVSPMAGKRLSADAKACLHSLQGNQTLLASCPLPTGDQACGGFYVFLCNGHSELVAPADAVRLTSRCLHVLWCDEIVATYDRAEVIAASREPLMPPLYG